MSGTASRTSASRSRSRATRRRRSCGRSPHGRRRARPSTTWSRTASRWTSRSPSMAVELRASSPEGARLVALAEQVGDELAARAGKHDRDASYPFESIETLRRARYFAAPIPADHGGLGVESVHDVVVAASPLARADASVAIGVNMHFAALLNIVRRWRVAVRSGNERRATAFATSMHEIATCDVIMAAAVSEPGQ